MMDVPEELQRLSARLDALERRVQDLEHPGAESAASAEAQEAAATAGQQSVSSIQQTAGWFPVLGRAMLGIAGAYALRAAMESGALPRLPVALIALAYALTWVVWAMRAEVRSAAVGGFYAATSMLILGPMLWELVLRFNTLSALACAAVLCCFTAAAGALAWKHTQAHGADVVFAGAAVIALALAIATHALMPFLAALLLMNLPGRLRVPRGQHDWSRALVALVTDGAVWLLIFLYSAPPASHPGDPLLDSSALLMPSLLLFLMDGAAVAWRAVRSGESLRAWQTLQAMMAFVLAAVSVFTFLPATGAHVFGIACLGLSVLCYAAAFRCFRAARERRNFRVFSAWSGGLLLAGMFWSAPLPWAAAGLAGAALAGAVLGVRLQCMTLDFHGVLYLGAGALAAGLPAYVLRAFSETLPGWPSLSFAAVALSGAACYWVSKERPGEAWREQVLHLALALVASCAAAALLVQGLLGMIERFVPLSDFHAAFTRTLALCAMALLLAYAGSRWQRLEMTRIAYAALAFMAVKLFYEDLREGRMEFIAASIFLFAVTLIAVPRMARVGHRH